MAGFSGNPRIWSRLRFLIEKAPGYVPHFVYDRAYQTPTSVEYFTNTGMPAPVVRKDHKRFSFATAELSLYSDKSVVGRTYDIINSSDDTFDTAPLPWDRYGVSQNAQGLLAPNMSASAGPLWDLSGSTTPSSSTPNAWAGEWSDDGTVFASILRPVADATKVYLSVKQNGTTLVSRQLLGIKHIDGFYGHNFANRKIEIRLLVRAANDIWLFHYNESSPGSGNRRVWLSVWNGSTISSTTMLNTGTYDVMSFDALRGTTGLVYLVYALRDRADSGSESNAVNYRSFVRSITEDTKTLSAVLHTSPQLIRQPVGGDYTYYEAISADEGDRLLSNRAFTYKGKNYLVHVYAGRAVVVYTYEDSAPNNITLLRWGFVEKLTKEFDEPGGGKLVRQQTLSSGGESSYARNTAIEYDPVSDTAFLVTMIPNWPGALAGLLSPDGDTGWEHADKERVYVTRHWQALDAPTWGQKVEVVSELPSYVFSPGTDANAESQIHRIGYIPSREGLGAIGLLFFQSNKYVAGDYRSFIHIVRTQNWHAPTEVEAEVVVDMETHVLLTGARTYEVPIDVSLKPSVDVSGVRNRSAQWNTFWGQSVDVSINGEVHIDLALDISISGALALQHSAEIEIDFNDSLSIQIAGETERVFLLDHRYWSVGTTFLEEFTGYMNDERALVWGLPPIAIMGYTPYSLDILKTLDIAQTHSDNMAEARWHAHGAEAFPVGWQTASQRLEKITELGGENIQFTTDWYEIVPEYVPTAWEVYLEWKNSPPHYAQMMQDWGQLGSGVAPYVFHSLAYTAGRFPKHDGGGPPWDNYPIVDYDESWWGEPRQLALYWTDNFMFIKEGTVQTTFVERWQTDELMALLLEERWAMSGLVRVRARHDSVWSMTLHAEHTTTYGGLVRNEHTILSTHSVSHSHESVHSNSVSGFPVAHFSLWDVEKLRAAASHELQWSRTLAAEHTLEYGEALRVSRAHDAPYGEFSKLLAWSVAPYGEPIRVSGSLAALYAMQTGARAAHTAPMLLGPTLRAPHDAIFDLQLRNPVRRGFTGVYDLLTSSAGAVFLQPQTVVTMNGRTLEVDDGYIDCDFDSPGYTFECQVKDLEFIRGATTGNRLDVLFEGTAYVFFLSNLSSTSDARSAAEKVTIKGLSPIFLLDTPYAETVTYAPENAKMFSEVIQEALGVPVDFSRHIDWMVPYGRAQSSSQTPLGLVKGFLESVGSRLLSNPDGSLYVLARYPVGFDALPSGIPPHAMDETNNVFVRNYAYDYAKGYNRFRVRDSDTGYGDMIEFDQTTSIATVWVSPYRTSWRLECTTTPGVLLNAQGETVEEKEELWDFKAGSAQADYPILELVSLAWVTDSLGGVSFEPHSTKVSAPVTANFGYGLAKVVYRTKCSKFELISNTPIEATQLILVEL